MLETNHVLLHPFVIGELACGHLRNREEVLRLLLELPSVNIATDHEVRHFIEQHGLMARGLAYLDMHLLASVKLYGQAQLWTRDKCLAVISRELSLAH